MNKGETAILVTGDANRNKIQTMPGGGFVTNEIKLPENWTELVAPLAYEPIENFYISGKFNVDGNDGTEKKATGKKTTSTKQPQKPQRPLKPMKK